MSQPRASGHFAGRPRLAEGHQRAAPPEHQARHPGATHERLQPVAPEAPARAGRGEQLTRRSSSRSAVVFAAGGRGEAPPLSPSTFLRRKNAFVKISAAYVSYAGVGRVVSPTRRLVRLYRWDAPSFEIANLFGILSSCRSIK